MNVLKTAAGWATGFNWYKIAAIAAILLATHTFVYMYAANKEQVQCEQEKTAVAEARTKAIVEFVGVQIPYINKQEETFSAIRYNVGIAGEKYEEAVNAKLVALGCDLTDAEFLQFNALIKETR